jgi:S-adenosylmethionine/arginine decarboxylase-like enzyme
MSKILEHKHLIVRARVSEPPKDVKFIKDWMKRLVAKIDMKILKGPYAVYSDMVGNRGLTAVTIIETSHIAMHSWDEEDPALLQLDVYTCSTLNVNDVLELVQEFDPVELDYYFIDRETEIKLLAKTPKTFWEKVKNFTLGV